MQSEDDAGPPGASAYNARLPGDEFTMFLVTQANGLGHDTAVAGRISSGTSAKKSIPFAPSRRGSAAGETRTASLGISCAFSLASASSFALKRSSTRCMERVAGEPSSPPHRSDGRPSSSAIRQSRSAADCSAARTGLAGRDEFWLNSGVNRRRRFGDEYLRLRYRRRRCILRRHLIFVSDGGAATIFTPAPRSGASRSSSPAMQTRVKRAYRRA